MNLEARVFEQELSNFISALLNADFNLGQFGEDLVSNSLITQGSRDAAFNGGVSKRDKAEKLTRAILEQVKQNAERFEQFIFLMKTEPHLEQCTERILKSYWEKGGSRCLECRGANPPPAPWSVLPQPEPPVHQHSSGLPPHPLKKVPLETAVLMNEVAAAIPAKWRAVGAQLKVPAGILDAIQAQGAGAPQGGLHCFGFMLEEWRSRRTSEYTWENLISVLRSNTVGEAALADKLAKICGLPNQPAAELPVSSPTPLAPVVPKSRINEPPSMEELKSFTVDGDNVTIMTDVAERWKDLGIAFNFDPVQRTVQKIEQKHNGDPQKCCVEMFQLWLKTKGATWGGLINVLECCQEVLLASQVKSYVGATD